MNLEELEKDYGKYKIINKEKIDLKKEIDEYEKVNGEELDPLLKIYHVLKQSEFSTKEGKEYFKKYGKTMSYDFALKNKVLLSYLDMVNKCNNLDGELREIKENSHALTCFGKYIALQKDNSDEYDLIDINTNDKIDISDFDLEKKNFIIELLKSKASFIGFAFEREIPFVKNLIRLNEIERQELEDSDMDYLDKQEELYYGVEIECTDIGAKLKVARSFDKEGIKDLDVHDELDELWQRNEERISGKKKITKENNDLYLKEYYSLLMLKSHNIEGLYKCAIPEEHKEMFINTYFDLMKNGYKLYHPTFKIIQVMTTSPLINEEVSNLRQMKKIKKINL